MIIGASALSLKTPDSWQEVVLLTCAVAVTLGIGWRIGGSAFAVPSALLSLLAFAVIGNVAVPCAIALVSLLLYARGYRLPGNDEPGAPYALEIVIVLAGLGVYTLGRYAVQPDAADAFRNTEALMAFERGLQTYFEADLQRAVLRWDGLTGFANWTYSFAFLAITTAILIWLWAVDRANYRLLRNSLAISVLLAIPTIALFPVAPPRLVPDSGLIDSIAVFGREHAFANEYAAMPSLHAGWMAVAGFVVGRSIGGKVGWAVGLSLGPLMVLDVIATGNHFWMDGAVGIAYCLGAALFLIALSEGRLQAFWDRVWDLGAALGQFGALAWSTLTENAKARFSSISLGALLAYLIIAQYLTPGFTDYWGYLTAQVAVFLVLLVVAEVVFEEQGGLSWLTHGIAVACAFADVLGTDGNLYARIDEYDKLTHFAGVAAITAGLYDSMRAMVQKGWISRTATDRLFLSISVGIAIGIAWEVYELIGDRVFNTTRVGGRWDTSNDIVSDSLGAIVVACYLYFMEVRGGETEARQHESRGNAEAPELPMPTGGRER